MRKPAKPAKTVSRKKPIKKAPVSSRRKIATVDHGAIKVRDDKPLHVALREDMIEYSNYVIEDRAVPAYQDGLKPVHRRVLWALYHKLNSRPEKNYFKSARAAAETMAFHPHSTSYPSIVKMIEGTPCALLTGLGNFGGYSEYTQAGADRYTELKLSEFTMAMFFDPRFKKAYETVPNFDGLDIEPIYLPAQLPLVIAREQSGIAVGVTTDLPTFTLPSLYKAVTFALKQKENKYTVSIKTLVKTLQFTCSYGGKVIENEAAMTQLMKTGVASFDWQCDYHMKGDTLYINGFPPQWSFDAKLEKIREIKEVSEAADISQGNDICIKVSFRKVSEALKETAISKVIKLLKSKTHYKTNVTLRYLQEDELVNFSRAKFEKMSIQALIARWTANRVALEKTALKNELSELAGALAHQQLMKTAVDNLDIIFKILRTKGIDKVAVLAKQLKITKEQSQEIWQIAVGRLDRLSLDQILNKIKELNKAINVAKTRLKNPEASVLQHMEENKKALLNPVAYEKQPSN